MQIGQNVIHAPHLVHMHWCPQSKHTVFIALPGYHTEPWWLRGRASEHRPFSWWFAHGAQIVTSLGLAPWLPLYSQSNSVNSSVVSGPTFWYGWLVKLDLGSVSIMTEEMAGGHRTLYMAGRSCAVYRVSDSHVFFSTLRWWLHAYIDCSVALRHELCEATLSCVVTKPLAQHSKERTLAKLCRV